jgi:hypothetical protein
VLDALPPQIKAEGIWIAEKLQVLQLDGWHSCLRHTVEGAIARSQATLVFTYVLRSVALHVSSQEDSGGSRTKGL